MPITVGNPVWITLIADADTPAPLQSHHGERLGLPEGTVLPPAGKQDTISVAGATVHGFIRNASPNPEFVMTPAVDSNVSALNAIPGPQGWTDPTARQTYIALFRALLKMGASGPELRPIARDFYSAAVADYVAAHPPA